MQTHLQRLAGKYPEMRAELLQRAAKHDLHKFSKEGKEPYTWLTHKYKCLREKVPFDSPGKAMEKRMETVVDDHYKCCPHHPEYHATPDAMSEVDVAEMICDWQAVSDEYGSDINAWIDDNVGKRWKFDESHVTMIHRFVGDLVRIQ